MDGTAVGLGVGWLVGATVRDADGRSEGTLVDFNAGAADGKDVGKTVGLGVG